MKEFKEDVTQSANVDGGKIDTFDTKLKSQDDLYKKLFELNDADTRNYPILKGLPEKYQKVINTLYDECIIFDKNSDCISEISDDEDIINECNITLDEEDGVYIVKVPFVYGSPDTRVTYNEIYFTNNDAEDVMSASESGMEPDEWFVISDIDSLIEFMFEKGIA